MVLFLNDIAGSEVLLILIFILIFFGSKSIPGIAKTLGKTMHQIKQASSEVQNEIKKSGMGITKEMNLSNFARDIVQEVQEPVQQSVNEVNDAVSYSPPKKNVEAIVEQPIVPLDQQLDSTSEEHPKN